MGLMGWSTTAMAARYQHITDHVRRDIAKRIGGLIWEPATAADIKPEVRAETRGTEPAGTGQSSPLGSKSEGGSA